MRVNRTLLLGILGVMSGAQVCSSLAEGSFKQKPGLWAETTVQVLPAQSIKVGTSTVKSPERTIKVEVKVCVGTGASRTLSGITKPVQQSCTKKETHVSGSTTTVDAVCHLGQGWQTTTHSVTTVQGDTGFHTETHNHIVSPYWSGDGSSSITAKWVSSSCLPGMKPGDAMGPDGKLIRRGPGGQWRTVGPKRQ